MSNPNISVGYSDPYVGEIRVFAFYRVPERWLPCEGQLLQISDYEPLFAVIGTSFGGDGKTNFALPNAPRLDCEGMPLRYHISPWGAPPQQ